MNRSNRIGLAAAVWLAATMVHGQEWTRFRGPNGTGQSETSTIPVRWTDDDYRFVCQLPGEGHSSPVVWGTRVFLTTADEALSRRAVVCVDAENGRLLWEKWYDFTLHERHLRNSFASATPAVDAERVYVVWSTPQEYSVLAIDHAGQEVWRANLGLYESQHSCGTSPVVFGDTLVLNDDQDGTSSLVALEAATGEMRWRMPRKTEKVAYSTPCSRLGADGKDELIFNSGAHGISAIDPATGATKWELSVFDKRSVSSPIVAGGLVFGSCGSGNGGNFVVAVQPPASETAQPKIAYRIDDSAPYVPTPVEHGGLVFLWSDAGIVSCIRASTGESVWRKRVGGNYSGSPVCVAGHLYCIAEDGNVVVLAADDDYQLVARNPLGEDSRSTPAVANGRLYLRTYSRLFCLGG